MIEETLFARITKESLTKFRVFVRTLGVYRGVSYSCVDEWHRNLNSGPSYGKYGKKREGEESEPTLITETAFCYIYEGATRFRKEKGNCTL